MQQLRLNIGFKEEAKVENKEVKESTPSVVDRALEILGDYDGDTLGSTRFMRTSAPAHMTQTISSDTIEAANEIFQLNLSRMFSRRPTLGNIRIPTSTRATAFFPTSLETASSTQLGTASELALAGPNPTLYSDPLAAIHRARDMLLDFQRDYPPIQPVIPPLTRIHGLSANAMWVDEIHTPNLTVHTSLGIPFSNPNAALLIHNN